MQRSCIAILLCGFFLSGCFFTSSNDDELSSSGPVKLSESSIDSGPRDSLILQVQHVLKEKGYNPGPLDGLIGRKTRAALKNFQAAENIRVSGNPDSNTLNALGLRKGKIVRQLPEPKRTTDNLSSDNPTLAKSSSDLPQVGEANSPFAEDSIEQDVKTELNAKVNTVESLPETESQQPTTQDIIAGIFKFEPGFIDSTADLEMVVIDQLGREHKQTIHQKVLELEDGGKNVYYRINSPANVQGTVFLSRVDADGVITEQLLSLPALKKVKTIKGASRFRSFMGSEFTYEDLGGGTVCTYKHNYLRDEIYNGRNCMVVESVPVESSHSGYSRKLSWVDKESKVACRVEYYDRSDRRIKTAIVEDVKKYSNQYWRPGTVLIENQRDGKSTRMTLQNYSFATGISENDLLLE